MVLKSLKRWVIAVGVTFRITSIAGINGVSGVVSLCSFVTLVKPSKKN
jgi:hypothetical protein